mmetsp:Transcript_9918/g.24121  ORF Transcript_9918/g.24121 Transcript_9918/m.24121 type:complete len:206 (-) Transcript_9918:266-883(-)
MLRENAVDHRALDLIAHLVVDADRGLPRAGPLLCLQLAEELLNLFLAPLSLLEQGTRLLTSSDAQPAIFLHFFHPHSQVVADGVHCPQVGNEAVPLGRLGHMQKSLPELIQLDNDKGRGHLDHLGVVESRAEGDGRFIGDALYVLEDFPALAGVLCEDLHQPVVADGDLDAVVFLQLTHTLATPADDVAHLGRLDLVGEDLRRPW